MSDAIETITYDAAVALLPEGDNVHTLRGGGSLLIGADWRRGDILEALREAPEIRLTGQMARAMKHGIAISNGGSWLFIETPVLP